MAKKDKKMAIKVHKKIKKGFFISFYLKKGRKKRFFLLNYKGGYFKILFSFIFKC